MVTRNHSRITRSNTPLGIDRSLNIFRQQFGPDADRRSVVAFCGTRGVPANYGGFETAVDEISLRFTEAGIDCDVFCRLSNSEIRAKKDRSRRLVYIRGSKCRCLDTFISSLQTGWHLWKNRKRYEHVFWFNNANFPGIIMTILAHIPTTVNTDGLEWRRAKWSWPFKAYYFLSSFLISWCCRSLVSDSRAIQEHYRKLFGRRTCFIPYGVPSLPMISLDHEKEILHKYDLERGRYFLQITRIEPDNLPLRVVDAFRESGPAASGYRMVVVGYKETTPYAERLIAYNGRYGVHIRNAVYDSEILLVLRKNCYCYVHGNSVGGTNPALIEAMATCPRVMAIDCEFSHEVLGDSGLLFDSDNIASVLNATLELEDQAIQMRERVSRWYSWDEVARSYMRLADGKSADYRQRMPKLQEEVMV